MFLFSISGVAQEENPWSSTPIQIYILVRDVVLHAGTHSFFFLAPELNYVWIPGVYKYFLLVGISLADGGMS